MNKIELNHLAGYLPYGLKVVFENYPLHTKESPYIRVFELDCGHDFNFYLNSGFIKPILRPLSDLTKEIEVNGEKFVPMKVLVGISYRERINIIETDEMVLSRLSLDMWECLYSLHFDLHNLIPQGLAIDVNTIKTK